MLVNTSFWFRIPASRMDISKRLSAERQKLGFDVFVDYA
jgi:hypothetical protein